MNEITKTGQMSRLFWLHFGRFLAILASKSSNKYELFSVKGLLKPSFMHLNILII
jgi:hypothetical protein